MSDGRFDAHRVWQKLLREEDPLSVFMAVPTVYNNLVRYFEENVFNAAEVKSRLSKYRLMVSGSAALPVP
jgi:malonyl-CoA/methylmalonyl-CoA synthetase